MARPHSGWVLFGVAVGAVAGWLLGASSTEPSVWAQESARAGELLAVARDGADGNQLLYLVDGAERTLCIYQFDPRKGKLKLAAARHLAADEQLLEFNNDEPHVADIEKLVRSRNAKE